MLQRVITAIVLLGIVLGALFLDRTGIAALVLVGIIGTLTARELFQLIDFPWIVGLFGSIIVALPLLVLIVTEYLFALPIVFCIATIGMIKWNGSWVFSSIWFAAVLVSLLLAVSQRMPAAFLCFAIPIWAGDTAAIFAGKAFGKNKLAPNLSPNKTWEGSIANLLAAMIASGIISFVTKIDMKHMLLMGATCGVIGQAGDLFESWLKRNAGVKDSGTLLPGHGGIFDRVDSLIAVAPFACLILGFESPLVLN